MQKCSKQFKIIKLPNVLVLQLNRFDNSLNKICSFVDFPIENLDINQFIDPILNSTKKYDLKSIIEHYGNYTNNNVMVDTGNHYISKCLNDDLKTWYIYDDISVQFIDNLESVKKSEAYILFYC